jgi:hypothetical protein
MRIRIRILLFIKVLRPLVYRPPWIHHEPPGLQSARPRPSTAPFDFNSDTGTDPAFHSNVDPDPASQWGRIQHPKIMRIYADSDSGRMRIRITEQS